MGVRVSTQGRKRVSSRLSNSNSTTTKAVPSSVQSTGSSTTPTTFTHITSSSSQSSDGIFRNGRKYHTTSKSTYWLPNDDEEMDRYIGQHFALKALFDGNIPKEALDGIPINNGAKILDLGCGPGTWIMDVATEYPSSELIGIDMCDMFPSNIRPANVDFKIGNILEKLDFPDNSFDMIHFRFFVLALRVDEWANVLKEIKRVLKPGGFLYSLEPGMLEIGSEFVVWAGTVFKDKVVERGQEPYIAFKMKGLMEEEGFEIASCVNKETYPGRSEHLNREFLWDLRSIFKGGQLFLQDKLGVADNKYPQFLDALTTELQKQPESQWPMVATLGRKPF